MSVIGVIQCKAAAARWRLAGFMVFALAALAIGAAPAQASTGINQQINYQARLLNAQGATVPDGNYNIEFKIYQDGTGCVGGGTSPCSGTLKWTEDWLNNNSQGVTVTNGYFSVMLGAGSDSAALGTAVDFNQNTLWLSINIGNTNLTCASFGACSGDGEMTPFTRFAAAPYALNSGLLNGVVGTNYARLDIANNFAGTQTVDNTSATGFVLQNTASNKLLVADLSNQKLGVGAAPSAGGATLQVSGTISSTGTISVGANTSLSTTTLTVGGTSLCTSSGCVAASGSGSYIQNGTGVQAANFAVQSAAGSTLATALIKQAASQTGDLLDFQGSGSATVIASVDANGNITSSGTVQGATVNATSSLQTGGTTRIDSSGNLTNIGNLTASAGSTFQTTGANGFTFKPGTNNTTTFQVQNAGSQNLLTADTSNMRLGVDATYAAMTSPGALTLTVTNTGANNLTASTTYYYEVTAIDSAGGQTTATDENSAITTTTNKTITISWSNIPGASGYRIYRGTSSGGEVYLATVNGTATAAYTDDGSLGTSSNFTVPSAANANAYVSTNTSNNNLQLSVGGNGTATGQLYVSGTVPASAVGSVATGSQPYGVYVQGRYAYVENYASSTLNIYDVSNPYNPTSISSFSTGSSTGPHAVFVQGHYAYVPDSLNSTLHIYDISNPNPTSPPLVGSIATGTNPKNIYVQGRYAYIPNYGSNTFNIYDVANPTNPTLVSSTATGSQPYDVYVQGRYAYVTNFGASALTIYDVSNPAGPILASSISTNAGPFVLYVQGRYAYITNYIANTMTIYDVSNPAGPVLVGSTSTGTNPTSVYVQGRYAYVTNVGSNTMTIYDVSNPTNPTPVGSPITTNSQPSGVFIQGRYAYVTDYAAATLQVFDLGGAYTQQLQAGGTETGTLQVDTNATVAGDASVQGGLQVGQSIQASGNLGITGGSAFTGGVILGGGNNLLGAPTGVTVTPTCAGTCTGTYVYTVTAINATGGETVAAITNQTTAGGGTGNPLSPTVYNTIGWTAVTNATGYKIYRTSVSGGGSPTTTGLIGSVNGQATVSFKDTGIAGGGNAPPTIDTTGQLTDQGSALFQNSTNSATAFQVQNLAGADLFTVDTANSKIGTQNQTAAATSSTALVIKSGDATGSGASNSGNVTVDSGVSTNGTAGSISIGTGAYAHSTTIGNATGSSALTLQAGSGGITVTGTTTASGQATFNRNGSGTSDYTLGVTGAPVNDGASSLVRIGNAIASGNSSANGGTYLGLNAPLSGVGSAADFLNFQNNGIAKLRVDSNGNFTTAGTYNSQTISSAASFTGTLTAAGTINTTGGAVQTNSIDRITNGGALTNITGYTQTSGTHSITSAATSGNIFSLSGASLNTGGAALANLTFTNANSTNTATIINGLSITPTGTTNSNSNANTLNAISLPNVSAIANNAFYGLNVGTGYNDILRYNGVQLISGSGFIQNAAIDSTQTYSNLQKVGALNTGSIASGFGAISTANNITTSANISTTGSGTITSAGALTVSSGGIGVTGNSTIAGSLGSVTSFTLSGAISGGTSYSGSGNITSTGGVLSIQGAGASSITGALNANGGVTTSSGSLTLQAANNTVSLGNTTALSASGALTVSSGGAGDLTLTSGSGSIKSGSIISTTNTITTSGNISTTGSGTVTSAGVITAPTTTNTINGLIINSGALSGVTTLSLSGAISGGTSYSGSGNITSTGGVLSIQGSGASSFTGAINANGGVTTTSGSLTLQAANNTISLGSTTTLNASGALAISSGGSGNLTLDTNNNTGTMSLGGTNANAITLGNAASTGAVIVQGGTAATAINLQAGSSAGVAGGINIGNTSGANSQAIGIGINATSGSADNVTIGSSAAGTVGTVKLQGSGIAQTVSGSSDTIQTSTNSTTAFQVQSASGLATLLNVDTTTNPVNLVTNPSFEAGVTGWAAKGNAAISQSSAQAFVGNDSLKIDDSGTPTTGDGAQYAFTFAASTYTLSFYAKLDASSPYFDTLKAGWFDGTTAHDCLLVPSGNNTPVITTQWNRYYCTFTATTGSSQYFYINQADNGAYKYYVDAVQLELNSIPTAYRDGKVALAGAQISDSALNSCDQIITDTSGTFNCGSGLVNHINVIDGSGHSIMRAITQQNNGASSPDFRWMTRLANMLHAQEVNRGVDGATSYYNGSTRGGFDSVLQNIALPRNSISIPGQSTPTAPYIARTGIGLLQYGINDLATLIPSTGGATAGNLVDFKEALRTIISRYRASAVFEETTNNASCATQPTCISYANGATDTWAINPTSSTITQTFSSGTTNEQLTGAQTSGTDGTATICVPNDLNITGGTVDVGIIADSTAGEGGTHTFTVDGVAVPSATVNTVGLLTSQNTASGGGRVLISITRRIPIPAGNASGTAGCNVATQHKIVDTVTGMGSGHSTYIDDYQIEAPQPEPVLVLNVARNGNSNYSVYGSGYTTPNDADVATMNTVISSLVSEFDANVQIVDEDSALSRNPNFFSSDSLHPNDAGHAQIAAAVYKTLVNAPLPVQQANASTIGPGYNLFSETTFTVQSYLQQPTMTINNTPVSPGGLANLILNPSFETDGQNWIANGGSNFINRVTTQSYTGSASLNIVSTGSANDGARYLMSTITNGIAYTLSFSAKLDVSSAAFTTLAAGYVNNTPGFTACTLNSNTVVTTGWNRYSCNFTAASPLTTGSGGIWIGDSSASAHNFYIDGVLLQTNNTGTAPPVNTYDEAGSIDLIGDVTGPVGFQNASDSTTAFQIQNSAANGGNVLFNADTINQRLGFFNSAPTNSVTVGTMVTADSAAAVAINPTGTSGASTSSKGLVVQGSSGETGDQFEVQTSAGAATGLLFSVNGNSSKVQIGSATTDTTQILLQLDSFSTFADTATCSTTTNQGALYYNTNTNSIRSCVNGGWDDVVTTAGLGILAFGVVADTGSSPGDPQSLAGGSGVASGPCQPYWKSATAIAWTGCTAYSGGRKVIVAANSTGLTTTNTVAGQFQHLCLTAAGNQPALSTAGTEVANLPTFSANNPVVCLADVKFAAANNTITNIYDTRVFSNSNKQFVYTAAAMGLDYIAIPSTNKVTNTATAAQPLEGVVVASNGAAWASGSANAIEVTGGPSFIKTTAALTTGQLAETTTTTGYGTGIAIPGVITCNGVGTCTANTTVASPYTYLGLIQTTSAAASACSATVFTCGSALVNVEIR